MDSNYSVIIRDFQTWFHNKLKAHNKNSQLFGIQTQCFSFSVYHQIITSTLKTFSIIMKHLKSNTTMHLNSFQTEKMHWIHIIIFIFIFTQTCKINFWNAWLVGIKYIITSFHHRYNRIKYKLLLEPPWVYYTTGMTFIVANV